MFLSCCSNLKQQSSLSIWVELKIFYHYGFLGGIMSNSLRPQIPTWCDPEWKSLMERCWSSDPGERPSFSEISQKLRKMAAAINVKWRVVLSKKYFFPSPLTIYMLFAVEKRTNRWMINTACILFHTTICFCS